VQHVFEPVHGPQVVVWEQPLHGLVVSSHCALMQVREQPVGESVSSTHEPHPGWQNCPSGNPSGEGINEGANPHDLAAKPAIPDAAK
jgi:hypothetical protein